MQKSLTPQALFGLMVMASIWGASFLCIKVLLEPLGPYQLVGIRVGMGASVLWLYVLARGLSVPKDRATWVWFLLIGAVNVALPFFLITWGEQFTPSGLAGILNASTAVFGVLVAAIVFADEKLTLRKSTGVAIGLGGLILTIGPDAISGLDPRSIGQIAVVCAGMSYAVGASLVRSKLAHLRGEVAMAGMLLGATVTMVPLALVLEGPPDLSAMSQTDWVAMVYLGVMATAVAYMIFSVVVKIAGAGNTTLVTLMVAPVSVVLGVFVLDERLELTTYIGFFMIALGFAIIDGRLFRQVTRAPA